MLRDANLTGANLSDAEAAGADFRGTILNGANLAGLDVTSARIDPPAARLFAVAKNADMVIKQ